MDRRSWLWRRKSSEKSPSGETESSGSLSSHSERFSDEQVQPLSNNNAQSPEVSSKTSLGDEDNDDLKTLTDKLSDAMVNIRAKEDLVKQHAKVAEEAVSGWERAENEASALKKLIDALTQKNAILEERVGHLDGALKECLRQLRQAREEQEEKIHDAVAKKSYEWESKKSELENQVTELQTRLQSATTESQNDISDARSKLEAAEKQNTILNLNLRSVTEELELRIRERDLSTHAAETASKQHLDSIKKVAKLEAECRRLKAITRKANLASDHQSFTGSSFYVESFTDSQSDSGERMRSIDNELRDMDYWASPVKSGSGQNKNYPNLTRSLIVPSVEIDLMDDFLEMEKVAALPETRSQSNANTVTTDGGESLLRDELDAMTVKVNELENNLARITTEKENLEIALRTSQDQLKTYEDMLKRTEEKLVDVCTQLALASEAKEATERELERNELELENSTKLLNEAEVNLMRLQKQLNDANEMKNMAELKLEEAESQLKVMELEVQNLESSIRNSETELEKERKFSKETIAKCETLQDEVSRMKESSEHQRSAIIEEFRTNQDQELAKAAGKYAECQKMIASIGWQLQSLATLDDFLIESDDFLTAS